MESLSSGMHRVLQDTNTQDNGNGAIMGMLAVTSFFYLIFFVSLACFGLGRFSSPRLASSGGISMDPERGTASSMDQSNKAFVSDMSDMWKKAFIRKVYTILGCQLFATVAISSAMMLLGGNALVEYVSREGSWLVYTAFGGSFINLLALQCNMKSHPTNLVLLSSFTVLESFLVGFICSAYYVSGMGVLVIEAFAITSLVFIGLTLFTMQSKINFDFLGPFLFVALLVLLIWGMFASFFFQGTMGSQMYALAGVIIFALYTVYDTHLVLNRLDFDEAIAGAICLYLDFINMFLFILQLLTGGRRD